MVRNFIWNNKQPRIKYDKLIKNHCDGGLKLQDLELKNKAIKISTMFRLDTVDEFLKSAVENLLPFKGTPIEIVRKFNLRKKDFGKICIHTKQ